jgi:hypothetical protein
MLRTMPEAKGEEIRGVWRQFHKEEFHNLYASNKEGEMGGRK